MRRHHDRDDQHPKPQRRVEPPHRAEPHIPSALGARDEGLVHARALRQLALAQARELAREPEVKMRGPRPPNFRRFCDQAQEFVSRGHHLEIAAHNLGSVHP